VVPFAHALAHHGLTLTRGQTVTLQVNVGLLCNQTCRHCHLSAGPDRREVMSLQTAQQVVRFARSCAFQVIDITGGAPELNPDLPHMIELFADVAPRLMIRCNLTALNRMEDEFVTEVLAARRVVVVASVPSLNAAQLEAQRGRGVWEQTLAALKRLNSAGYGQPETGLELNLVSNPPGAFLPPAQEQVEKKFRADLKRKWGIVFHQLYTFANVPLGRYSDWLQQSGNYDGYLKKLASAFNPCTVQGLMCRNLISVSWDGYLYDCDFNLAAGIPSGGVKTHVSRCTGGPATGSPIAVSDHCYACTAGAGFT
jgi:radical SAM/Cys-rich protein